MTSGLFGLEHSNHMGRREEELKNKRCRFVENVYELGILLKHILGMLQKPHEYQIEHVIHAVWTYIDM